MTPSPVTVGPDLPLAEVAQRLLQTRYGGFPVVDGEGRLLGLVQVEDLLPRPENIPFSDVEAYQLFGEWVDAHLLEKIYQRYQQHAVQAVMRRDVPWVSPEDPLGKALEILVQTEIRRLPVVEGERVVGILTRSDFLKLFLRGES